MEDCLFCENLGVNPTTKVLNFLIMGRNNEYTITDIIRGASIGTETAYEVLSRLIKLGMVKKTKKIGNYQLYQLNKDEPKVRLLIKFYFELIKKNTGIDLTKAAGLED